MKSVVILDFLYEERSTSVSEERQLIIVSLAI